ncbi:MAG TPA: YggT family protein [Pyrinomonadaceae bacterium]|nr:YggT family protein [Pyrinomonadaceae bacterium]
MTLFGFFQTAQSFETMLRRGRPPQAVALTYLFIWYLIVAAILAVIALMLLRFILNYADMNPFSRPVIYVRRMTDPLVNPVRRSLAGLGVQPNGAPLVVVLLTILLGFFVLRLAGSILSTVAGITVALTSGEAGGVVAVIGYVLYGLLSIYSLLIVIRIIFAWGRVTYGNRVMRFLIGATDPLLVPLRQMIPPLGMFDISPIVAFIIIFLFQQAIAMTLLRGWPPEFFG